ncbi:hypothetical protein P3T76_002888 [Phytophthora citrophthora]|uniref:Uncharacterized protein n=1 Tax=Phytophthora citrophthora TaxID=4793 RepID=A0AAD9GWH1_9STRA|nr:hypothetical protein P3T76_002888 [Phytophthora citrophthora]
MAPPMKSSSSPSGANSPSPAESTDQPASTPISTALVDGVANMGQNAESEQDTNHDSTAPFNTGDSEASFWNIIADSHMNIETYGEQTYDSEMAESAAGFLSPTSTLPSMPTSMTFAAGSAPSTNLPPVYDDLIGNEALAPSLLMSSQASYPGYITPNQFVTFESRQDGTPFPLAKPIIREDGLLLVGTELVSTSQTAEKNRIFVTNYMPSAGTPQNSARIMVEEEVRDIHWLDTQTAIVAVGKDIQLIRLGDISVEGSFRLQDPINAVHSDSIREIAVSPTTNSYVLSGGFDETIVLTDLRNQGDPKASAIIRKFDANDVVSSVRWSPSDSHFSWTTDGGDFQIADSRICSPQLQVPLYSFLSVDTLGGLFTHEYLSSFIIALGFERGHIALIDTRMARQKSCTSLIESKLTSVGEMRRSTSGKFAIFGRGGFSTARLNGSSNSLDQITLQHQAHQVSSASYKSSGDFSYERGLHFAVSDNLGIVSVYTDDVIFRPSTAFNANSDW